jgi:hypothetical protein
MSNTDYVTDSAELRELRDSLSAVAVPERPPLDAITARGRARRRQMRSTIARVSAAAAVACVALVLGATGALAPAPTLGTIRTAAFKLVRNHNGTDTLTINPNELLDPVVLQRDLAKYGIPAKVTTGSFCSSHPSPPGFSQVVSSQPAGEATVTPQAVARPTISFDPAAIRAGTELSFGYFQLPAGAQQAEFALINTSSYTCTSTPPSLSRPSADGDSDSDSEGILYNARTAP